MRTEVKIQYEGAFVDQDPGGLGGVLALQSNWSAKHLELIRRHNVKVVRLSIYNGWLQSDISFLKNIPFIEGLDIFSEKVTDLTPIAHLKQLKMIGLADCKPKTALDLSKLNHLKNVFLTWRNQYASVFGMSTLSRVNIIDYPGSDLTPWESNHALGELSLQSKKLESLSGVERFPRITELDLFKCPKLTSLEATRQSVRLRKLALDQCRGISDLSPVGNLSELKELTIEDCGDIQSLRPLAKCKKLELLQVAGSTTVIDGDLSGLLHLPRLKTVLIARRKHYSHTDEELEARHRERA